MFPKCLRRFAAVYAPGVGLDSTSILRKVFIAFCRRKGDLACAFLDPYFFKGDRSVDTVFHYDGIDLNIYPIYIFIWRGDGSYRYYIYRPNFINEFQVACSSFF